MEENPEDLVSRDARIVRTRKLLWESLVELIDKRGYESISVLDVAEGAGVNRSTFYRHFEDKDDLFRQGFTDYVKSIVASMRSNTGRYTVEVAERLAADISGLLARLSRDKRIFKIAGGRGSNPEWYRIASDCMYDFLITERIKLFMPELDKADQVCELWARTTTAMFLGLISWWIQNEKAFTVEALSKAYTSILLKGVFSLSDAGLKAKAAPRRAR